MDNTRLIPIKDYAEKLGLSAVSVRQKCQRGNVPGAVKLGRDWLIPPDAPYPDSRVKSGKYRSWRNKESKPE